ncbi:hypothetical protein [Mesorhizobium sp. BHbdii]
MSDYKGPALVIDAFPKAAGLLGHKVRRRLIPHCLADRGIAACIPSKANRNVPIPHDTALTAEPHTSCPRSVSPPSAISGSDYGVLSLLDVMFQG